MKFFYLLVALIVTALLTNCVQKTSKKTVIFRVDVTNQKNIETVGIRGEKPLDWNYDNQLKVVKKDSVYTITKTFVTGYKFVEVKFTINGNFELQNRDNRRVYFTNSGTTYYKCKFNIAK